jgi:hypothetical protein
MSATIGSSTTVPNYIPQYAILFHDLIDEGWVGFVPEHTLLYLWDQCFMVGWRRILPLACAHLTALGEEVLPLETIVPYGVVREWLMKRAGHFSTPAIIERIRPVIKATSSLRIT